MQPFNIRVDLPFTLKNWRMCIHTHMNGCTSFIIAILLIQITVGKRSPKAMKYALLVPLIATLLYSCMAGLYCDVCYVLVLPISINSIFILLQLRLWRSPARSAIGCFGALRRETSAHKCSYWAWAARLVLGCILFMLVILIIGSGKTCFQTCRCDDVVQGIVLQIPWLADSFGTIPHVTMRSAFANPCPLMGGSSV